MPKTARVKRTYVVQWIVRAQFCNTHLSFGYAFFIWFLLAPLCVDKSAAQTTFYASRPLFSGCLWFHVDDLELGSWFTGEKKSLGTTADRSVFLSQRNHRFIQFPLPSPKSLNRIVADFNSALSPGHQGRKEMKERRLNEHQAIASWQVFTQGK